MAKNIKNPWDPLFLQRSKIFSDLNELLGQHHWDDWPGCSGLMALLDKRQLDKPLFGKPLSGKPLSGKPMLLASGLQLKMVPQDESLPYPEMGYEERIFKTGMISTREQNWHDLFNAFIWLLFPQTKIALNELHFSELSLQTGKKRTTCRDMITHFDESGIIIASTDTSLLMTLKKHQWDNVFIQARPLWWHQIGAFVFGHGMYEKAFDPFIGFTGKAYCINVAENFFQQKKMQQYHILDQLLADEIKNDHSLSKADTLTPLPILGIPGWYDENKNPEFYTNKDYFRDKRK
jgi:hypothetical protein